MKIFDVTAVIVFLSEMQFPKGFVNLSIRYKIPTSIFQMSDLV